MDNTVSFRCLPIGALLCHPLFPCSCRCRCRAHSRACRPTVGACRMIGNRWNTESTDLTEPHRYANGYGQHRFIPAFAYRCLSVPSAVSVFLPLPLPISLARVSPDGRRMPHDRKPLEHGIDGLGGIAPIGKQRWTKPFHPGVCLSVSFCAIRSFRVPAVAVAELTCTCVARRSARAA